MKYEVTVATLGGLSNKIFTGGEIVDETCFPEGNCPALVENGFLKEAVEEVVADVAVEAKPKKK